MVYANRDRLTVVERDQEMDKISFDDLACIILEKPANMIYFLSKGKLYGIISMGDIARASEGGFRHVMINKKFTRIAKNEYMRAREIFCHKRNINALPIVDEDNIFLGAYTRWNLLNVCDHIYRGGGICWRRQYNNYIFLVYPSIDKEKQTIFESFRACLISNGIKVDCIEHGEIINFLVETNKILFVDEDELRAMETLHRNIWNKETKRMNFYTYTEFIKECRYESEEILRNIEEKGVGVFQLAWECNAKNIRYVEKLRIDITNKYLAVGERVKNKLYTSMYQSFFDNVYSEEYANDIMNTKFQIETRSGCGKLRDYHSKICNVSGGERYTSGQPENYSRTIYFVGACYMYGRYSEDSNTIESFMQKRINQAGYKIKVVNCSSPAYGDDTLALARVLTLPLRKGDIVIYGSRIYPGIEKINLLDACYEHNVKAEWMVDAPLHCNHRLHAIYADAIYDELESVLQEEIEGKETLLGNCCDFIKTLYIDRYFKSFKISAHEKTGSIVMNCNPFTYGHRYLIEKALEEVDFLIIFVVEEDKSLFSFSERFVMVCEGTADLKNVMVVPSGPFILTNTTFPEYFTKATDEYLDENIENDIKIFAERIAPHLNICYRFAGEEPEDAVTNRYNIHMKEILPKKGIKFVEIPRKEVDGQCISASLARQCLEKYDLEGLSRLVPDSTIRVLSVPVIEET